MNKERFKKSTYYYQCHKNHKNDDAFNLYFQKCTKLFGKLLFIENL